MSSEDLLIALGQTSVSGDISANCSVLKKLIKRAGEAGADIIHFPEGALTGYAKTDISNNWSAFNWDGLREALQSLRQSCADAGVWAVIGGVCRPDPDTRPFNSLYIINSQGKMAARYDKRFCSHAEITQWYRAGAAPVVIEIKGRKIGFLLCIEIQFPELFMAYERLDVDAVLLSSHSDTPMFGVQAQGHAACNNFWVSFSVPANLSHALSSRIIGPDGSIVASCKNGATDMSIASINPRDPRWDIPCSKARPWRQRARQGDIYKT